MSLIRPARPSDLDALCLLEQRSFSGERLSRARFRHWIEADNGLLLVAVEPGRGGELLGYALSLWRRQGRSARLYSIAIAPEARGRGLGRQLLEAAVRRLRRLGRERYTLEVARRNKVAIALYEGMGFGVFGEYPGYYEDGQDALRMCKRLKG
ncbi:MAG TPA: N-acetyltransferase [Hyphomicrobiales bacterium]|nr:N-acetyltransferase [Hyphomicrobiales bacterium]